MGMIGAGCFTDLLPFLLLGLLGVKVRAKGLSACLDFGPLL